MSYFVPEIFAITLRKCPKFGPNVDVFRPPIFFVEGTLYFGPNCLLLARYVTNVAKKSIEDRPTIDLLFGKIQIQRVVRSTSCLVLE